MYFEEFSVNFSDKLNVLTGETGAGKSIIIRALQALVGKKVELPATEGCELEGLFTVAEGQEKRARELGIEADEIVVSLSFGKRWIYRVNGRLVPQSLVEELFEDVVQFHQQNSQTGILKKQHQLLLLDGFHGDERLVEEYAKTYGALKEVEKFVQQFNVRELEELLQNLRKKLDLIEKVNPSLEEEVDLQERYSRLMKQQEIATLLNEILEVVEDEQGLGLQRLWKVLQKVDRAKLPLPENIRSLIEEIFYKVSELSSQAKKLRDELELEDSGTLEARIWQYNELKRKFGPTIEDVLANYKKFLDEYRKINTDLEKFKSADLQIRELEKDAVVLASKLHEKRVSAARQLESIVRRHMKDLGLNFDFVVEVERKSELGPRGFDEVEMKVRSHKGEFVSLRNILSGGELSRLMLSIELACASRSISDVLVFDEVDTGIGGLTGNVLGLKLKKVSETFQTIVVTHLPQVARFADRHILVEKQGERRMNLRILTDEERNQEMIRMLGGEEILRETRDS